LTGSRSVWGGVVRLSLSLVLVAGCGRGGPSEPLQAPRPPEWYASNIPLMAAYLETLPDSATGKVLYGIALSDGDRWLEGVTYLGRPANAAEGLQVRLLDDGVSPRAYLWLERGAEPYPLDACVTPPFQGIRAVLLGDGPYAWKVLRPEHGVVYTPCPPAVWLPKDRPSNRPPPIDE
jgi:hypothetical protein